MRTGVASGFQVAFLIYAAWLLMVPLRRALAKMTALDPAANALLDQYAAVVFVGMGLALVAPLRRLSLEAMRAPVAGEDRSEVAIATLLTPVKAFAWAGAWVLWWHFAEGPLGLAQHVAALGSHDAAMARSLEPVALALHLVLAVLLGPVVEEVVFRRFLYRAWARDFGWFAGMMLTAVVFGSLHQNFVPSFLGSILFTCVYRRTGSLRAAIVVHAANNLLALYPLLGRWVFPLDLEAPGDLTSWIPQVTALVAVLVIWPVYVWMCREPKDAPIVLDADHAALPR